VRTRPTALRESLFYRRYDQIRGGILLQTLDSLRNFIPRHVHGEPIAVRSGLPITLGSGEAKPTITFHSHLRWIRTLPAEAGAMAAVPKVKLCPGVTTNRCTIYPMQSCGMICWNALSAGKHETKVELRQRVILVGREAIPFHGLRGILLVTSSRAATKAEGELRRGIALFSLGTCRLPVGS